MTGNSLSGNPLTMPVLPASAKQLMDLRSLSRAARAYDPNMQASYMSLRRYAKYGGLYGVTLKIEPRAGRDYCCLEWLIDFLRKAGRRRVELRQIKRANVERAKQAAKRVYKSIQLEKANGLAAG